VAGALGVVYLVWGSTYYAIRVAIDTMPPLLMAAVRFTLAGGLLYAVAVRQGDRRGDRPTWVHWRSALIVGAALLSVGNGGITLGEVYVPSGIAALVVATVPLWMALFAHFFARERLGMLSAAGIGLGLVGVAVLFRPGAAGGASPVAMLALLIAPVCWAGGSLYSLRAPLPSRPLVATAMEMIAGGAVLLVAAAAHGEFSQVHLASVSVRSLLAFAYLIVFGSITAFSAYIWLLKQAPTSLISTYAYVNPLVAVLLGGWLLDERISWQTLVAAGIIVAAVATILSHSSRARRVGCPDLGGSSATEVA
jgi:drug/metabolite transporter (DMT)-like permease